MTEPYRGSCLCGQVRFTIEGEFGSFLLCHCEHCRKDTGSAHAANLFSSAARLSWLAGEEQVRVYRLPASRHAKSFCSTCGAALPYQAAGSSLLVVPAGSLDGELGLRPSGHIFAASRADWDDELEALPYHNGFPR